jgi:hypothetical protein
MKRSGAPTLLPALVLMAGVAWGVDVTVDSGLQLGPDRWWSDVSTLTVSPAKQFAVALTAGRAMSATPVPDRAESTGAAVSGEVVSRLTATIGWLGYAAPRARVVDGASLAWPGPTGRRERHGLYSFDLAARVLDAASGEPPDENAFIQSVTVALGATTGTHRMPLEVVTLPASVTALPIEARVKDLAVTGGVTIEMEANTISVTGATHRYGWPAGVSRALLDGLFGESPDGVGPVYPGLPGWDVAASYREALPWQGSSATVAYVYTRLAAPLGLARTISAELGWSLAKWLVVRGGALWLRRSGETTRFAQGGVSLFF